MNKTRVKLSGSGRRHVGELEMPMEAGCIHVKTLGFDPVSALKRAAAAALTIASDPRLAPFIPPQAIAAASAIHALTNMSADGLKQAKQEGSPATVKVATKLLDARRQYTGDVSDAGDVGEEWEGVGLTIGAAKRRDYRKGSTQNKAERGRYKGGKRVTTTKKFGDRGTSETLTNRTTRPPGGTMYPPAPPSYPPPAGVDQYGNPVDQYGNPVDQQGNPIQDGYGYGYQAQGAAMPPQWYGGGASATPLEPADYQAMAAWGEDAFAQDAMDSYAEADNYFGAYEDRFSEGPYGPYDENLDADEIEPADPNSDLTELED